MYFFIFMFYFCLGVHCLPIPGVLIGGTHPDQDGPGNSNNYDVLKSSNLPMRRLAAACIRKTCIRQSSEEQCSSKACRIFTYSKAGDPHYPVGTYYYSNTLLRQGVYVHGFPKFPFFIDCKSSWFLEKYWGINSHYFFYHFNLRPTLVVRKITSLT